ncbi:hypothetical protein V2J09_009821 [Rumex salicifolius]
MKFIGAEHVLLSGASHTQAFSLNTRALEARKAAFGLLGASTICLGAVCSMMISLKFPGGSQEVEF